MAFLLYLGAIAVALVVLYLWVDHYRKWKRFGIPGPMGFPIIGNTVGLVANTQRVNDYLLEGASKYGSTWGYFLGPRKAVFVNDPACCDYFLKKNFKNYEKGPSRADQLRELLGDGIFVANGEEWKMHRHLAKPLFRSASIDNAMVPVFVEHMNEVVEKLRAAAKAQEALEITQVFMQYTMSTFLSLGLGCDKEMLTIQEKLDFAAAFDFVQTEANLRAFNPFWKWFITGKFKENVRKIDDFVYRIIGQRKKDSEEIVRSKTDIFSQFLLIKDDEGKPLSDKYLRDVFMNFLLAGRDTTAALITWTFFELAKHPEIKEKVLAEIEEVVTGDAPTAEQVHKLVYTKQVMTEVLRLHPSVPIDMREVVEDDVLPDGHKLAKGTEVYYSPYAMGRMEALYADPLRFDPDRWTEANAKKIPPGQFTAFHWGPQTCLGKEMAYVEARVVLAVVLKQFELKLADDPDKTYQNGIILLPKGGLMMLPVLRN